MVRPNLYWGCKIKGCDKKHSSRGYCKNHYSTLVEKHSLAKKKWKEKNKKHLREYRAAYMKIYYKKKPWVKTLKGILSGLKKRNLKNSLTPEDLKYLWFRDKGYLMKRPSIDRIDNNGDYIFKNCRYLELSENIRKDRCGEDNYNHKLTWEQVRQIRKEYIPYKMSSYCLAKKYNVSRQTIARIVRNEMWKEITI